MKQKNIPIRQHYIPQFILRNFSANGKEVLYFNKNTNETEIVQIRDIFMEKDLYTNNDFDTTDPYKIEKELSKLENDVAIIIKNKFLLSTEVSLTKEEDEILKLFFAVLPLRNDKIKEKYKNNLTDDSKERFLEYQPDGDFEKLWSRNIGEIAKCRSLSEILDNDKIDEPFKIFMKRDIMFFSGKYFVLLERRGREKFIIGDCYPVDIFDDAGLTILSYYPISPDRMIILAINETKLFFNDDFTKKILKKHRNILKFSIKKIYEEDVKYINSLIIKHSIHGVIIN